MGSRFLVDVATRIIWVGGIMALVALILLLLVASTLILLHIIIVSRACRQAINSSVNRGDGCVEAGNGLSAEDVEKLPCFEFSTSDEKGGGMDCAVCLESFELGDRCRLLPFCQHSFHAHCVDCWLVRSAICPICRSSAAHRRGGGEVLVLNSD